MIFYAIVWKGTSFKRMLDGLFAFVNDIGVLLFELMACYSPWQGNDVQTVKYNISRL